MAREQVLPTLLQGGSGLTDRLPKIVRELAGLSPSVVAGVSAGSKMDVAAMRDEDTLLAALVPPAVVTAAVAAAQTITVDGTGGTWSFVWNAQTAAGLAFDITAVALQAAIVGLSNVNPGDVVVTGGVGAAGGGTPYTLTWNASLGAVAAPTTIATTLTGTKTAVVGGSNGTTQVSGAWVDDTANITIQSCKATGTLTFTDQPHDTTDTVVVNDVTYTFKTAPTAATHVKIGTTFAISCDNLAATINAYEARYTGSKWNDGQVYAASNGVNIVTLTSVQEGAGNGATVVGTVSTLAETTTDPAAPYVTSATVIAGDTVTVNGVTFTARAEPALETEFDVKLSNTPQATEIARCFNAYAFNHCLDYEASINGAKTIFRPTMAKYGNLITLTEDTNHCTASGGGYLAGGTSTGGFKSTTNLTGKSVFVFWYNKR